jgi:hypothetical protein
MVEIELTEKEFEIIAGALDFQIKRQTEELEEMYQNLSHYSERREKSLKGMIEETRKVYQARFEPVQDAENLKWFEAHEFIPATKAVEKWGLSEGTVRKAIFDKRMREDECRKEGRDWKVSIAGMKRLYGEPKK